jgi:hypothetical protein
LPVPGIRRRRILGLPPARTTENRSRNSGANGAIAAASPSAAPSATSAIETPTSSHGNTASGPFSASASKIA